MSKEIGAMPIGEKTISIKKRNISRNYNVLYLSNSLLSNNVFSSIGETNA